MLGYVLEWKIMLNGLESRTVFVMSLDCNFRSTRAMTILLLAIFVRVHML